MNNFGWFGHCCLQQEVVPSQSGHTEWVRLTDTTAAINLTLDIAVLPWEAQNMKLYRESQRKQEQWSVMQNDSCSPLSSYCFCKSYHTASHGDQLTLSSLLRHNCWWTISGIWHDWILKVPLSGYNITNGTLHERPIERLWGNKESILHAFYINMIKETYFHTFFACYTYHATWKKLTRWIKLMIDCGKYEACLNFWTRHFQNVITLLKICQ